MGQITDQSIFVEPIYELETTDPVQGGPGGVSNTQAQQLANRTRYLYDQLNSAGLIGGESTEYSGDMNDLYTPGFYLIRSTASNTPITGIGHALVTGRSVVPELAGERGVAQLFLSQQISRTFFRFLSGSTWSSWFELQRADFTDDVGAQIVGMVAPFATSTAPSGWLACSGQAVSRTTYASLFNRIGTTWGAGNGTTTFNLPDLRGEYIRGFDNGRGVDTGRVFASAQAGQAGESLHSHTYDKPNIITRYVQDLGVGNGDAVSQIGNFTVTPTSQVSASEPTVRNIAMLYCIKY